MTAAADVLAAVAGLGVPWWGWTALVVMIFWGLLAPGDQGQDDDGPTPEEQLALARRR
ncbi:hypothetical protein AB0C29_23290 [Actinoplanes sp. NPDC048791]|uniref:hypothetical protein n=1 Tax=Actinoplanes sp. NPDC048791 TaxID=3154623 RepID=UPI0033CBC400